MSIRPREHRDTTAATAAPCLHGGGTVYTGAVVHVDRPRAVVPTAGAWARRQWYGQTPTERVEEAAAAARAAAKTSAAYKQHSEHTLFIAVRDWMAGGFLREQAEAEWGPITHWNTSIIQSMTRLFRNASTFDQTLEWDTRKVMFMDEMFQGAAAFTNGGKPLYWDVSSVLYMPRMFERASAFDQTLVWDVRRAEAAGGMFNGSPGSLAAAGSLVAADDLHDVWDACYAFDLFQRMDASLSASESEPTFSTRTGLLIAPLVNAHTSIRQLYNAGNDAAFSNSVARKVVLQLHDVYIDVINKVRMHLAEGASTSHQRTRALAEALLAKVMHPKSKLVKERERRSPYRQRPRSPE